MSGWVLGIIGGSGLYDMDGLQDRQVLRVETPWGNPSDHLVCGTLCGVRLVFLPRHGRGHRLAPADIPYRANIAALKLAGATDILSVSACGALHDRYEPGQVVAVDQFVDRTHGRPASFFGSGLVAHVSMAEPVCRRLSGLAADAVRAAGGEVHRGGTYLAVDGPHFSSRAESLMYRQWGCDVIGMTNMPEAKLAREAELPYATLAMVTDRDCWGAAEEAVSARSVLEVMAANTVLAQTTLARLAACLARLERTASPQQIETCLDHAVITPAPARDPAMVTKLQVIAGRVLEV